MSRKVIKVGVIGHVDHGRSCLATALMIAIAKDMGPLTVLSDQEFDRMKTIESIPIELVAPKIFEEPIIIEERSECNPHKRKERKYQRDFSRNIKSRRR